MTPRATTSGPLCNTSSIATHRCTGHSLAVSCSAGIYWLQLLLTECWWRPQALTELLLLPDDGGNLCLELSLLEVADAAARIATDIQNAPLQALQRLQTAVALAQEIVTEASPKK